MNTFKRAFSAFGITVGVLFAGYIGLAQTSLKNEFPIFSPWIYLVAIITIALLIGWLYYRVRLKADTLEHQFLFVVNHTFRTPLTRIKWMGDELMKDPERDERSLLTQNISNTVDRVLGIVDLLVGLEGAESRASYVFKAVSFREIVEVSIARYREELAKKKISLSVPTFADIPLLTLDNKKLSFVVNVLIENAAKYTPAGGSIAIDCFVRKNNLILYVADSGIGLTFKEKYHVFERFYRSPRAVALNTDGMGLGLYLSKIIVNRHGGNLRAKSHGAGKGTTLILSLPLR